MQDIKVAVIGGSGLNDIADFNVIEEKKISTPFGNPSDSLNIIEIDGIKAAFLPRHGRGHFIPPGQIPVKANIYALKSLGVDKIISISAVGSLQEKIAPEDFVIPDQIIDLTKGRQSSLFELGMVGHISMAEPFCNSLREIINKTLKEKIPTKVHFGGTYICIEGPAFSTRAESNLYRSWDASIIGMTAVPECKIAREAEMSYAMVAMSTDYDCWKEEDNPVTVEMIIEHMLKNTKSIKTVIPDLIKDAALLESPYRYAAKNAIITSKDKITLEVKKKLKLFYENYF